MSSIRRAHTEEKEFNLETALRIAGNAKLYARRHVFHGSTQLENNASPDLFHHHHEAVKGMRNFIRMKEKIIQNSSYVDLDIDFFDSYLDSSSKYSIGNCQELAFQALDYILRGNYNISAECYEIEGGNHTFLVLNRKKGSNPSDPSTWGPDAVICDPWSNKVYPVSEYRTFLKAFYIVKHPDGRVENRTKDFDAKEHKLCPYGNFNTEYMRERRTVRYLKDNFHLDIRALHILLIQYTEKLEKEKNRLSEKYGKDYYKIKILNDKILQILELANTILQKSEIIIGDEYKDYTAARLSLARKFDDIYEEMSSKINFSGEERLKLYTISSVKKFFGVKSGTERYIKEINTEFAPKFYKLHLVRKLK